MKPDWNVHLVESVREAETFLTWLSQRRPVLAYDTETTGLHPWGADKIRMAQFGDGQDGWAIDTSEWKGLVRQALSEYKGPLVGHNLPFDRAFTEAAGLPWLPVAQTHDTMVMAHLINPARALGLKQLGDRLVPGASAAQFDLKNGMMSNGWDWATVPTTFKPYWVYAASDVCLTARLAEDMMAKVVAGGWLPAYEREMAVADIAYRMEKRGLLIDVEYTSNLLMEWELEMSVLLSELDALGVSNPRAAQQVAQAMQMTEGWEPVEYTPSGQIKMDDKVMVGVASEISVRVLRYRRLLKWSKAYLRAFLSMKDGQDRVHPNLKPLRARTGRWSITEPALQTLPRGHEIRDCLVPDAGKDMWMIDYSGMEMVGLSHYSNDAGLLGAIHAGEDLHTYVAREVYGDPTITKDDDRRNLAKNAQFCKVYGGGNQKIADTAKVSLAMATEFTSTYNARFPGVPAFLEEIDRVGRQRLAEEGVGYIMSVGGRRIPCDEDKTYALTNYLIQGGMADVFKMKLIELDANGFENAMLLPVHDEIILQFDKGDTESAVEAARIMEDREMLRAPLTVEISGPYDRWGSKYAKGRGKP